jgi:hypothetical protein
LLLLLLVLTMNLKHEIKNNPQLLSYSPPELPALAIKSYSTNPAESAMQNT